MIAVQVFVGLVLFAAFLGLLTIVARLLMSAGRIGRDLRAEDLRGVSAGRWVATAAVSLAGVVAAGALGWALA